MNEITIVDLANEQEYLKEVSEWIWKEWSKENGAKYCICPACTAGGAILDLKDELLG